MMNVEKIFNKQINHKLLHNWQTYYWLGVITWFSYSGNLDASIMGVVVFVFYYLLTGQRVLLEQQRSIIARLAITIAMEEDDDDTRAES